MMDFIKRIVSVVKATLYKDRKIIAASVLCGVILTVSAGLYTKSYSDKIIKGLSGNIIRFHVLANSDNADDQELKLAVKDAVLERYSQMLSSSETIGETRAMLCENIEDIRDFAQSVVKDKGYDYSVSASISKDNFPTKAYGDITLPAGKYETLRIEIGESAGQNWWCVMFPPLCFVDAAKNEIDPQTKEALKSVLTDEEYALLNNGLNDDDQSIKIKFKIVEWWQERSGGNDEEIIVARADAGWPDRGCF